MKMCKIWAVMAIAVVTLLTSCLGDSSTKTESYDVPGVVTFYKNKYMVLTAQGYLYSPALITQTTVSDGDCVLVSYLFDSGIPENADVQGSGYATVTLYGLTRLTNGYVSPQTDITKLLEKEITLKKAVMYTSWPYADYQLGNMFLTSSFMANKDQVNAWGLYLDPNQEPEASASENGNIYTAYMRAVATTAGTTPASDAYTMNAFNIEYFVNTVQAKEKAAGKKYFQLKINYIKDINEDSTFTWTASDVLKFEVPSDDK